MDELRSCPNCEKKMEVSIVQSVTDVEIQGKPICFIEKNFECNFCKEKFYTSEMLDRNLLAARTAYDELYRTPSGKDLIELRNKYNLSQKSFALLLGVDKSCIELYETEEVLPDPSKRLLLRLAMIPEVFKEIYKENKDKIGLGNRKKVEFSNDYITKKDHFLNEWLY